jgi:hypothetical protein
LASHLNDVAVRQNPLALNPVTVDVRAMQAAVYQQKALRGA